LHGTHARTHLQRRRLWRDVWQRRRFITLSPFHRWADGQSRFCTVRPPPLNCRARTTHNVRTYSPAFARPPARHCSSSSTGHTGIHRPSRIRSSQKSKNPNERTSFYIVPPHANVSRPTPPKICVNPRWHPWIDKREYVRSKHSTATATNARPAVVCCPAGLSTCSPARPPAQPTRHCFKVTTRRCLNQLTVLVFIHANCRIPPSCNGSSISGCLSVCLSVCLAPISLPPGPVINARLLHRSSSHTS